jgi:hypothetical protein
LDVLMQFQCFVLDGEKGKRDVDDLLEEFGSA